jgi:uncharacterized protein YecE (DUF72 family)
VLFVGTSGWQYPHWRGGLYPHHLPTSSWLAHYAAAFQTVEVNSVFYRLPASDTFAAWAAQTPADFVFALKASRFLTHTKRLQDPREPVERLLRRAQGLAGKLGPVLLQLPPTLTRDASLLDDALACFPPSVKVVVEPREPSWFVEPVAAVLERHDAALCLAERPGWSPPAWRTATWGYVRFHEGRAHPRPCFGRRALERWARTLQDLWPPQADVYAYFNNDGHGCAPSNARLFALLARRIGLDPTRVPARDLALTS